MEYPGQQLSEKDEGYNWRFQLQVYLLKVARTGQDMPFRAEREKGERRGGDED